MKLYVLWLIVAVTVGCKESNYMVRCDAPPVDEWPSIDCRGPHSVTFAANQTHLVQARKGNVYVRYVADEACVAEPSNMLAPAGIQWAIRSMPAPTTVCCLDPYGEGRLLFWACEEPL